MAFTLAVWRDERAVEAAKTAAAWYQTMPESCLGRARLASYVDGVDPSELDPDSPLWRRCSHRVIAEHGARCAAIINPRLVDEGGAPYGQIGWFRAEGEAPARRALDRALGWLAGQGCRAALGPMNGSTWHSYRFAIDEGEEPPFPLEPTHPPAYPRWWSAHGFRPVARGYLSTRQDNRAALVALAAGRRAAEQRGYRVEPALRGEGLPAVLARAHELARSAFGAAPFFSDLEPDELGDLYRGIERLLQSGLVHWLRAPDGEVVGFGFGYLDGGGERPRRSIFKSMAIAPAHQGLGLASALFHEQAAGALALGAEVGVRALFAEGNRSGATGDVDQTVIRRYALLSREIG